jgi:hypothetical protein
MRGLLTGRSLRRQISLLREVGSEKIGSRWGVTVLFWTGDTTYKEEEDLPSRRRAKSGLAAWATLAFDKKAEATTAPVTIFRRCSE